MQVEVRTRESKFGDLLLDGNPDDFDKNKKQAINQDSARVGARYALSPQQDIIASFIYAGRKENNFSVAETFNGNDMPSSLKSNDTGYLAEIQHLFRRDLFNTIMGFNSYQIDVDQRVLVNQNDPQKLPGFTRKRNQGYIYTNLNFSQRANATLGFSYVSFDGNNNLEINKFNPKFGLQLDITNSLRLRMAWFETVKSALIANQTLEPTQVAGFNQLFDDINGTKAKRKGVGLDATVSRNILSGIEVSVRNLSTPTFGVFEKQKEELYRAYLYWLPYKNWSIRSEPQYEKFTRKNELLTDDDDPTRIENLSLPLEISYFDQRGYLAKLTGTYVLQDIKRQEGHTLKAGTHDFFMLDTSVGYRLPKRRGLVSLEARNLLDQDFIYRSYNFQFNDYRISRYIPERTFFARVTLNF
jgi:hypothetical protein